LMNNYDGNKIVNIGTGEDITIRELTDLIAEVVGYMGEVRWDTTKPDGPPRNSWMFLSSQPSWKYKTPLKEGLHLAYNDFLKKAKFNPTDEIDERTRQLKKPDKPEKLEKQINQRTRRAAEKDVRYE